MACSRSFLLHEHRCLKICEHTSIINCWYVRYVSSEYQIFLSNWVWSRQSLGIHDQLEEYYVDVKIRKATLPHFVKVFFQFQHVAKLLIEYLKMYNILIISNIINLVLRRGSLKAWASVSYDDRVTVDFVERKQLESNKEIIFKSRK